ncbi:response regulator, partial [Pseudomonas qingdaonensis]
MHLLVVEDDDIVRMLTVEVLDELGYKVIEAEDAAAALRVLEDPSQTLALM